MADRQSRRGAPLPVAAVVAAVWAATVSYAPVLALVAIGGIGSVASPAAAARVAMAGWLLAHGVAVETPADRVTLIPLAVFGLAAWRVGRAGLHASRACGAHRDGSLRRPLAAAFAVAVAYAGVGTLAASAASTGGVSIAPARAGLTLGAFACVAATYGAVRHSRAGQRWLRRLPVLAVGTVRVGVSAALLMLAGGATAAGVSLALRGGAAAQLLGSYQTGLLGQAGITVLCLAYSPNLAIWACAYLLGPGFSLGVDTVVSPGEVLLGPVPAVPILAGVPSTAVGFASVLVGVPLAGAAWSGWAHATRLSRQAPRVPSAVAASVVDRTWIGLIAVAFAAGPVAGLCVGMACLVSAGSLGSGRLSLLGPVGWGAILVAAGTTTVGVLVGVVVARLLTSIDDPPIHPRR